MKAALFLLALPALLAGCLGGEPALAALPTGQIDGAVVDPLLRPYGNHTVELVQLDRVDVTSALGGFTFRAVPVGFYTLTTHLEGGPSATQVVDVQAGKVTRVILQLIPEHAPQAHLVARPFQSGSQVAQAGQECTVCAWSHALDAAERPTEVILEATWQSLRVPLAGADTLRILVSDEAGFPLYDGEVEPGTRIAIQGSDLPDPTHGVQVHVWFGPEFLPRSGFAMSSVLKLYYGATSDELLAK